MNAERRKRIENTKALIWRAHTLLTEAWDNLEEIKDEEQDAYDNLPESFQESDRGEAMTEAIENLENAMDLDWDDLINEMVDYLDEAIG